MSWYRNLSYSLFLLTLMNTQGVFAKHVIPFWHSYAGYLGTELVHLTDVFNASQNDYKIKPIYKGIYPETLTSFVAAYRAGVAPPLIQIFEIGTATMLYPEGVIRPVFELSHATGIPIDESAYLMTLRRYYGNENQQLLALPFSSSAPVLYYNKTFFNKAGIDLPKTLKDWSDFEPLAKKVRAKFKKQCLMTSAYPSWVHFDSFLAMHGLPMLTQANGSILSSRLNYQIPELTAHLSDLKHWQDKRYFQYGGRDSDPVSLFTSGKCPIFTESSGAYHSLKTASSFEVGVLPLLYDKRLVRTKGNSVIGGSALWVISGFDEKTYHGIALFLQYLSKPTVQARWSLKTGYIPVSKNAMNALLEVIEGQDDRIKGSLIAYGQIQYNPKQKAGERLGYYPQIRLVNDELIESILFGTQVEDALESASKQSNYLLKRFALNHQ